MAYRLKAEEILEVGVKRAAQEQITKALARLADANTRDREEAVHDARKAIKKTRALLRLAQSEMDKKAMRREDRRFREVGRHLSELRDDQVMVATLDALRLHFDDRRYDRAFAKVRKVLVGRQEEAERALGEGDVLREATAALSGAAGAADRWPFVARNKARLPKGVVKTYRDGLAAYEAAFAEPSDESFHTWRKRVKDLWYHLRLLKGIWPPLLGETADSQSRLADYLGADHDLAVLRETLRADPAVSGETTEVEVLIALAKQRSEHLRDEANTLALRLYAEKPGAFARRYSAYYRAWRAEQRTPAGTDARGA